MFTVCPKCDKTLDCFEPIGNFDTRRVLCEPCADAFGKELFMKTVQDALDLAKRLSAK